MAVSQLLSTSPAHPEVSLLAVDGDCTPDVEKQLSCFPRDATHVFVSCGGNDALCLHDLLEHKTDSVIDALKILNVAIENFRSNYRKMLDAILEKHANLCICTVYNKLPGIAKAELVALALFNEVIIEEAVARQLPIIDLRVICNEVTDFSEVSPIEPSAKGGQKIANAISRMVLNPISQRDKGIILT
jgi:hypothetical protein